MKVILIYPPDIALPGEEFFITFPLGIGYLAAVLEKEGHDVHVLDALIEGWKDPIREDGLYHVGLSWSEVKAVIRKTNPDLVGISCLFTSQSCQMHKTAELVKSVGKIPVVVGGAHPTALPKKVLEDKNIDYVVLGEGEATISKLVSSLQHGKKMNIDGLAYREGSKIKINPKTEFIENLDSLPYPAWHLFPMEKYFSTTRSHATFQKRIPYITIITSRGCPFSCTFCAIHQTWGHKWRPRDPNKVVDEIEFLVEKYGIKEIHFEDDNMTLDKKRVEIICDEIIRRGLDISWTTPNGVRVDTLDRPLLEKMKKSGCYALFLGIESGNSYVLNKLMNKRLSIQKVRKIASMTKKMGIKRVGFFIVGMPGEKREHIKDTIRFMLELDLDDIFISIASPYPGSELYKKCVENNWLVSKDFSTLRPKYGNIRTDYLTPREVRQLRNIGYLEYEIMKFIRHPTRFLTSRHQRTKIRKYSKYLFKMGV